MEPISSLLEFAVDFAGRQLGVQIDVGGQGVLGAVQIWPVDRIVVDQNAVLDGQILQDRQGVSSAGQISQAHQIGVVVGQIDVGH